MEVSFLCKAPPTFLTHVIILRTAMRQHVGPQIRLVRESFATVVMWARKGLFPGVRAHVTLQQPRPTEQFTTEETYVLGFHMSFYMRNI